MSYCTQCGAYIPDGQTACPACGFDGTKPHSIVNNTATEKKSTSTSERVGKTPTAEKEYEFSRNDRNSKLFAALSYVSIMCFVPFIVCPNDAFAKYHGKQGILLLIISALIDLIGKILGSGFIFGILSLFRVYLLIKGILNAVNGRMEPLPYVGQYAEKF